MLKYVDVDRAGGQVSWDRYFDYIRAMKPKIAGPLYEYVSDWAHYSLDGQNSLHDSWLSGVQLSYGTKDFTLEFLGAHHDRWHAFHYVGVQSYKFDLDVHHAFGDGDVLIHEFRFDEDELVTHEIVFPREKRIVVTCRDVTPSTRFHT